VPLDPRVKRFLDVLAAGKPPSMLETSVAERRLGLIELMKLGGPETPVGGAEDRTLPGPEGPLAIRIYTPLDPKPGAMAGLIYFHGGGLVAGSIATHDSIARRLANAGECRVISVDYSLAPEHPFPAALDEALAAVSHIGAHAASYGIDGARLGICGDSAGATLAAATAQALARIGGPPLALQLLMCPILDYSRLSVSRRELASGYLVDQATLEHDLLHYAPPGSDPADPRISPLRAGSVAGLPRTLIHTAEFDPLRDEGRDYCERLAHEHIDVSYTCHAGMIHLFYGLGAVIPYARTAFEQIGGEIRAALGTP
jgi:acetyl esterase